MDLKDWTACSNCGMSKMGHPGWVCQECEDKMRDDTDEWPILEELGGEA
jgi:hypothetical protein